MPGSYTYQHSKWPESCPPVPKNEKYEEPDPKLIRVSGKMSIDSNGLGTALRYHDTVLKGNVIMIPVHKKALH